MKFATVVRIMKIVKSIDKKNKQLRAKLKQQKHKSELSSVFK
jgi:hypothetical protein